jgi:hypothetical protein
VGLVALRGGVAPGWLTSTQSPEGKLNFGAELHPKSKAAQRSSLARSLQFMTSTFLKYEKSRMKRGGLNAE